ncbi:hypothetical protein [Kitasatospora purpeofusca]|uniref:hypothetical protein n=1 Tax=Kitasatospora purpeofusca TaxID=67352 RepID=UPI0038005D31
MSAIATATVVTGPIAAIRACFPGESVESVTEGAIVLQLDPYGDRLVKVEAASGTATISLVHPQLGPVASASRSYADDAFDGLTDDLFKFLKGVFNYTWM